MYLAIFNTICDFQEISEMSIFLTKLGTLAYSHYPRADEGNNSVFESFSILSVLVFIEVFAIIFCLLF